MSYPPDVHILRDLSISGTHEPERAVNRIPIEAGLLGTNGLRLGVMATLLDVTGAGVALRAVRPDWIATADLSAHLFRPILDGVLEVECRPLRCGAGSVVVDAELRNGAGELCGSGRMAFARLPGSVTTARIDEALTPSPVEFSITDGDAVSDSILERCGIDTVGPGQLRFEKAEYIRNSFGTVNGGVLALAAEAAAVSAAGGGDAHDLQIHYLEQIGDGPVGVTAEVVRDDERGVLCLVRIEDRSTGRLAAISDVSVGA